MTSAENCQPLKLWMQLFFNQKLPHLFQPFASNLKISFVFACTIEVKIIQSLAGKFSFM